VEICKENLKIFKDGGHQIVSKIITGDETYVHYYDAPTHREAKLWVYEGEVPPSVVKSEKTAKKICYAVFFRSTGLVKAVKLEGQKTITAKWYTEVCLPKVFEQVMNERPKSGLRDIIFHHDNARPHTAQLTTDYLKEKKVKIMRHSPYSPDIALCDFWLFGELKKNLRGRRFGTEEELDAAVMEFFEGIPQEQWLEAFKRWQDRMQRVIDNAGEYIAAGH
jgi:histone-lysine N-methyltransferase SETMAR